MIFILILFLSTSIILAITKPTYFIIFYLLATTKFLGFIDIDSILINNYALGFFLLNIITLVSIFIKQNSTSISKRVFSLIIMISMIFGFGIIYPNIMGFSNFFQSIIGGKEFLYLSILLYLIAKDKSIDIQVVLKFIKFIGLYLSIILIINFIADISPIYYEKKSFIVKSLEVYYLTYISLAMFIIYHEYLEKKIAVIKFFYFLIIMTIGLVIGQHNAILITTLIGLISFYILAKKNILSFTYLLKKIIIIIAVMFIIMLSFEELRNSVLKKINGTIKGTDIALIARDNVNIFRWDAINKEPYFGYGFIHQSSNISKHLVDTEKSIYTRELYVIDSGYVDLLIKFGYVGTFLLLIIFIFHLIPTLKNIKYISSLQLGMFLYLSQYFIINYTWSVFSYAHGIVPASIAIYLLHTTNYYKKEFLK